MEALNLCRSKNTILALPIAVRNPVLTSRCKLIILFCSSSWKDQSNAFRTDPNIKLKSVPTLMKVGTVWCMLVGLS